MPQPQYAELTLMHVGAVLGISVPETIQRRPYFYAVNRSNKTTSKLQMFATAKARTKMARTVKEAREGWECAHDPSI
jgi:hypothetical protein